MRRAVIVGVALACSPVSTADVWYVDSGVAVSGDGRSWAGAFSQLRMALQHDDLASGDQIRVAAGTHYADQYGYEGGSDDPTDSFVLPAGVAVYGGFPPGGGPWSSRDAAANPTILSGAILGDDEGPPPYCVPAEPGAGNCQEETPGVAGCLDPICCALTCEAVAYCCFVGWDTSCVDVAAQVCAGSRARHVVTAGGGAAARLDGFTITGGLARGETDYMGDPVDTVGGGIRIAGNPIISNCVFTGNFGDLGGAVGVTGGAPRFFNCTFQGNQAGNGGAVYARASCAPLFVNCVFTSNTANAGAGVYQGIGGAVYAVAGNTTTLIHCTLIDNIAIQDGGALHGAYDVRNSILWANGGAPIVETATVTGSCVQGGHPGAGNLSVFPGFASALDDNFRLGPGSPCIDAAMAIALPADAADLDGDLDLDEPLPVDAQGFSRQWGPAADLGAWEFCPFDVDADGDVGVADFIGLIGAWAAPGPADFDGSGVVDTLDMLMLLGHWGGC